RAGARHCAVLWPAKERAQPARCKAVPALVPDGGGTERALSDRRLLFAFGSRGGMPDSGRGFPAIAGGHHARTTGGSAAPAWSRRLICTVKRDWAKTRVSLDLQIPARGPASSIEKRLPGVRFGESLNAYRSGPV